MKAYRLGIAAFSVIFIGIGIALLIITTARGGGTFDYVMGVLFLALGAGRLYLLRRRR